MSNQKAFNKLLDAVNKMKQGGGGFKDPNEGNYWKLEGDKAGNGSAVIRFLPAKDDDSLPYVKVFSHGFQSQNGKWFIEQCPTTIGQPCPVCESNAPLWNSGVEANKEIVRKRKRKVSYISNVLVVQDRANPDNEGKVFMFKYGQKIFDKLMECISPPCDENGNQLDPDFVPFNPFDAESGADFKLMMRRVEGYANFDKSEFRSQSELDDVKSIIKQLHDINQFVDAKTFKSYDDLSSKLAKVLGTVEEKRTKAPVDDDQDDTQFVQTVVSKKPAETKPAAKKVEASTDDDDLAFFQSLADDDN